MDAWINLINYASALKTAGIRMRTSAMAAILAGTVAAASHKRDMERSSGEDKRSELAALPSKAVHVDPANPSIPHDKTAIKANGADDVVRNEGEALSEVFDVANAELTKGPATARNGHSKGEKGAAHVSRVNALEVSRCHFVKP
jgi:hypothetical protein